MLMFSVKIKFIKCARNLSSKLYFENSHDSTEQGDIWWTTTPLLRTSKFYAGSCVNTVPRATILALCNE